MPTRNGQRIAVIGGVAAGPAAAAEARRADPDADIVLFEQGPHISYGACEMPYYVADWIDDHRRLIVNTPEAFERSRGVTVRVRHRVEAVHPRRDRVVVRDLEADAVKEERFDKIILAVGARARMPGFDGEDAPNVFTMRRLDDAVRLKAYLKAHEVGHAVILGGGYIGVEMAEALRERGVRVSILEPAGRLLPAYVDDDLCGILHGVVESRGVVIRWEKAVRFEQDRQGRVDVVVTDRGERVGCQLVVVAMGVVANTELATAAGARTGETGALAVDDQMRTNVPGLWACGDLVEVTRVIDHKQVHLPLSPVAFRSAHVAGRNAARKGRGGAARFPGVCVASAVKVFGLEVAAVGLRLGEAREAGFDAFALKLDHWSRVRLYPGSRRLHLRYIVNRPDGRLLGAEIVGEEGAALRADVLVPLIREGWKVSDIRDLDLIYTPPVAPSIDPLLIAAHRAEEERGRG